MAKCWHGRMLSLSLWQGMTQKHFQHRVPREGTKATPGLTRLVFGLRSGHRRARSLGST